MLLNENFVDIEKPGEMCSPIFVADEFSGMILHPTMQARNQEFFSAGEVSENRGTSINI